MSRVSSYLSCNWKTGGWNLRRIGFNTVISIASLYLNWKYLKFCWMDRPRVSTLHTPIFVFFLFIYIYIFYHLFLHSLRQSRWNSLQNVIEFSRAVSLRGGARGYQDRPPPPLRVVTVKTYFSNNSLPFWLLMHVWENAQLMSIVLRLEWSDVSSY